MRSPLLSHEEVFSVHVEKHTKDVDAFGRRDGGDERELPRGVWAVEVMIPLGVFLSPFGNTTFQGLELTDTKISIKHT